MTAGKTAGKKTAGGGSRLDDFMDAAGAEAARRRRCSGLAADDAAAMEEAAALARAGALMFAASEEQHSAADWARAAKEARRALRLCRKGAPWSLRAAMMMAEGMQADLKIHEGGNAKEHSEAFLGRLFHLVQAGAAAAAHCDARAEDLLEAAQA